MLPGIGGKSADLESLIDEKQLKRMEAIVLSMTKEELHHLLALLKLLDKAVHHGNVHPGSFGNAVLPAAP